MKNQPQDRANQMPPTAPNIICKSVLKAPDISVELGGSCSVSPSLECDPEQIPLCCLQAAGDLVKGKYLLGELDCLPQTRWTEWPSPVLWLSRVAPHPFLSFESNFSLT